MAMDKWRWMLLISKGKVGRTC